MTVQKTVLITGAAGGIGSATVKTFADAGWLVIGVDRKDQPGDFPKDGLYIQADISKAKEVATIYKKTAEFTEYLNGVVNNAALQVSKSIQDTSVEEWDLVMASNLRPAFLGAKLALPLLKKADQSAIVNVSSVHAVATSVNVASYAASKGGLLALTRAMAIEFAPDNIRVNAVLPGAVDTNMLRDGMGRGQHDGSSLDKRLENLARKTVNGRIGTPEEIANTIFFLIDEGSSFITGQALVVDGGATARLSTE